MFKRFNLTFRIYMYIFSIIAVTMLIITAVFYQTFSNKIIQENIQDTKNAVGRSVRFVELYITTMEDTAKLINYSVNKEELLNNNNKLKELLDRLKDNNKNIKQITIFYNNEILTTDDKNIKQVENFVKKSRLSDIMFNSENKDDPSRWNLTISRPLITEKGELVGRIVIDFNYSIISSYFSSLNLGKTGDVIIFDRKNNIIWYKNYKMMKSPNDMVKKFYKKSSKLVISSEIKNTTWKLIAISSQDNINVLQRNVLITFIIILLVSLILINILIYLIIKMVTKPIRDLTNYICKNKGYEKYITNTKSYYEADILVLEYNNLIEKVKYLHEYEIKALYSQINPHFLYNTLDTIIWMAEFEDTEKVIEITKSLSNLFRISLSEGNDLIPLSDEIKHLKEYLYIQKQRYLDKLSYKINIEKNLKADEILVPKIILQPIAENSIYHGIKNSDRNGIIVINIFKKDDKIIIEIIDNGVGFKNSKSNKRIRLGGIGIQNVDKRLKYYYGKECGVKIENVDYGAKVVLVLRGDKND